jgi:hypothetical protein
MDRLTGLRSFVLIAAAVFAVLRLAHLAVPLVFPETRQGPVAIASLDEVRQRAGFAPILPAYRPAFLGERPASLTITLSPHPTLVVVWRGNDHELSVTQQRGGPMPHLPPLSRPFEDVADAVWWTSGSRLHLVVPRGAFWIHIETSLSARELRRLVDTLTGF